MSKGLEALQRINENVTVVTYENFDEDISIIEKELKDKEELETMYSNCVINGAKQKKALEIIKEKRVNIDYLRDCKTLEDYNNILIEKLQLTQEEYDLLKEVLL